MNLELTQKELEFLIDKLENLRNFEVDEDDRPTCKKVFNKLIKLRPIKNAGLANEIKSL